MRTNETLPDPRKNETRTGKNSNGHGGRRAGSGRKSNAANIAKNRRDDQLSISEAYGQSYHKQLRNGSQIQLSKDQALMKNSYEKKLKSLNEKKKEKSTEEKADFLMKINSHRESEKQAAEALIKVYNYCRRPEEVVMDDTSRESDSDDTSSVSSDEDFEDEELSYDDEEISESRSRTRSKYMPPKSSTFGFFLDTVKSELLKSCNLASGKKWYYLNAQDLKIPEQKEQNKNVPSSLYCQEVEVFVHAPFNHFEDLNQDRIVNMTCPCCNKSGNLHSNGWCFRPAHKSDSLVWILHQRLRCERRDGKNGCGRTCSTFHPGIMKQLPNAVTESFPFLMTASGLGMHESLMQMFMVLCTKGILFSTFAASVNAAKRFKYWRSHLNYLDKVHDKISKTERMKVQSSFHPMPFSPYDYAGEYNGIDLKPSLVKKLFLQVGDLYCVLNLDPNLV